MASGGSYLQATRQPWSCVLFVLPLLILYEVGLNLISIPHPDLLRNGADTWLRGALASLGLSQPLWAPALLLGVLLLWCLIRPAAARHDAVTIWTGMVVESVVFALVLYGFSRGLGFLLDHWGIRLALADGWLLTVSPEAAADPALARILSFLGAGIYEETLFRLLLLSALGWLFTLADFPPAWAWWMAALCSALFFAAAHHLGPNGEAFHSIVFSFRVLAGLYFALLYCWRGFGIAVGAHTGYDVLVGVLMRLG